jgi:TM2 domain-containing membrane protein YozV
MPGSLRTIVLFIALLLAFACRAGGPLDERNRFDKATLDSMATAGWVVDSSRVKGENTRLVSSLLTVLLGPFGAHRLYLGTTPKVVVIYGVTFGGFGVLALLDLGHILFTKDLDPYKNNDRVFMWGRGASAPTPP